MFKRFLFFIVFTLCGYVSWCQSQEEEYTLKAAFIYNFTKYISWSQPNNENDFIIGIVGPSLIYEPLQQIARSKSVNDKKITIRRFDKPSDINFCNILFIPKNGIFPLSSILTKAVPGMLTISEEDEDEHLQTAFNFILKNDKLRFESNIRALNSTGLKASSQLLKLAIIVE